MTTKEAVLLVMTHGEDFGMVPITDKYNSRSGPYEGAYFETAGDLHNKVALEIRASRDLEAGEPITTSYYVDEAMGVPELLRDYGYIEPYPQKYIFHSQNVAFVVMDEDDDEYDDDDEEAEEEQEKGDDDDEGEGDKTKETDTIYNRPSSSSTTPNLKVKWLQSIPGVRKRYMHPKQKTRPGQLYKALSYLHRHYDRLVALCPRLSSSHSSSVFPSVTDHELRTTIQFCNAMLAALHAALVDLDILTLNGEDQDLARSGDEL